MIGSTFLNNHRDIVITDVRGRSSRELCGCVTISISILGKAIRKRSYSGSKAAGARRISHSRGLISDSHK